MKRHGLALILCFLKKIMIFCLVFSVALTAGAVISVFVGYEVYRDVYYGDGAENKMDIFLPHGAVSGGEAGCVLFIHGGSWSGGDKSEEEIRCRLLASRGCIAVSMNYTLKGDDNAESYSVFTVLDEIEAAICGVKNFAAERGINLAKMAISGYSAGAHLAMLYAYSRGDEAPLDIAFVANMAGPADISPDVWGEDMTVRIARLLTGREVTTEMLRRGEADELFSSISPVEHVCESSPPTLTMHGCKDSVVPLENALSLKERLTENAVENEFVYLKNSDHSLIHNPIKHLKFYGLILDYCEKYFG